MNLKDKICLITGSANGIGEKCAFKFAEYGARLILIDQDEKITNISKILEKKYNREVRFIVGDITSKKVLNLMETIIVNDFKRIDILFNNAGVIRLSDDISKLDEKDWDLQVNVNLKSIYLVLQKIIPIMKNQNFGNILNTASMTGSVVGMGGLAGYCASKGGVIGLTKCVALELAKYNIRCNAIAPGTVHTPSWEDRVKAFKDPAQAKKDFIARQPMGRLGTPEEIANLAVYLASDESDFITGVTHAIDGGMSI